MFNLDSDVETVHVGISFYLTSKLVNWLRRSNENIRPGKTGDPQQLELLEPFDVLCIRASFVNTDGSYSRRV